MPDILIQEITETITIPQDILDQISYRETITI